ncbi:sialic acid-binding Ig-like lectin 14 [Toxotes jaculatrix]|uniref:sialic acid-binding Ig-like lectin 14 n=1 Tax=Toxotes jaculatrix TaxID=941984 RepID=UPI001B3A8867|nr:sialic acid-binding Ig-like lectin 14 [Toxotes jaculatrix]XP_040900678.1 sialic acid-binding Ig-like lectin 14 [Toxotes jaculatrix]
MARALNLLLMSCLLQGAMCQVFEVIIQKSIEALRGSCVTIPCSFGIENKYEKDLDDTCKAIWKRKSDNKIVFDSAEQTRKIGELVGNLKKKDCTTTLNNVVPDTSNTYYFRLECDNKLKYNFDKDNKVVNVLFKADPPSPTLTPSTLEVKEGTSVSLNCSAPAPCLSHPPTLTWTPNLGDSQETLQENQDKTKVKISVLTFTVSHLHHGTTVSCNATYNKQDGSTELAIGRSLALNVSFAPQILSTSDCTKTKAQLNCSCETVGNPPPILQWHSDELPLNLYDNVSLSYEHLNVTSMRSFIAVNQSQEKDFYTLLCRSSNSLGSVTQRFYLYRLSGQNSGESPECSSEKILTIFITTVGVLTAALVSSLLFAVWAHRTGCHSPTKNQCTDDKIPTVMSQVTSHEGNEVSIAPDEDIYANTYMIRKTNEPNTHLGHQQVAKKNSEMKDEEGSDVAYASVIWKIKNKKDGEPSGSSYMEEERYATGGVCRNFVSNAREKGSIYDNIVTGTQKAGKAVHTEYAQVNF